MAVFAKYPLLRNSPRDSIHIYRIDAIAIHGIFNGTSWCRIINKRYRFVIIQRAHQDYIFLPMMKSFSLWFFLRKLRIPNAKFYRQRGRAGR